MSLLTLRELTMAVLLATRQNVTLPVVIWRVWAEGKFNVSAAISLLLVAAMVPIIAIYFIVTRRGVITVG
jgi:ABC-type Fe3+ transport system permease subunit